MTFVVLSFSSVNYTYNQDGKCADLVVLNIEEPDWNAESESTKVKVTFTNKGKRVSQPAKALLKDFDPTIKELKKLPLQKSFRNFLIKENAVIVDDLYVDDTLTVPSLQPREKITLTFTLKDHWAYDPYCELKAIVNFDHGIEECRLNNNTNQFLSSK